MRSFSTVIGGRPLGVNGEPLVEHLHANRVLRVPEQLWRWKVRGRVEELKNTQLSRFLHCRR